MSTQSQITANIANSQHSTGPRTEAGKAVSSQNALKHGLTAQTVLLPGEDEAAYRKMCEGFLCIFVHFFARTFFVPAQERLRNASVRRRSSQIEANFSDLP